MSGPPTTDLILFYGGILLSAQLAGGAIVVGIQGLSWRQSYWRVTLAAIGSSPASYLILEDTGVLVAGLVGCAIAAVVVAITLQIWPVPTGSTDPARDGQSF